MKKGIQILVAVVLLSSCIDNFNPDLSGEDINRTLVVDGRITNQVGPYTVRLTSSAPVGADTLIVESGALVTIEEENGPSVILTEDRPGVYVTDPFDITGEVGKRYRLLISLFDGLEFESSWELMLPTPEIDAVRWEPEVKESQNGTQFGVQLFLDSQGDESSTFFRWGIDETWKYEAPLVSDSVYLGNNVSRLKTPDEFNKICWKRSEVSNIMITSVSDLSENTIVNYPLNFISTDSARFNDRYSALIKQYSLGLEEFNFWQNLENTNENVGSLFDRQPFQVTGNIRNVRNENVPVLGYFSANAETQTRIYINRSDFESGFLPEPEFSDCQIFVHSRNTTEQEREQSFAQFDQNILNLIAGGLRAFYTHPSMDVFNLTTPVCADCEVYGGSTTQPDFWEE